MFQNRATDQNKHYDCNKKKSQFFALAQRLTALVQTQVSFDQTSWSEQTSADQMTHR
jgi:hypothetical protein